MSAASSDATPTSAELDHTEIVDLARIVSKYAHETEKNLRTLLGRAERADHVLVFDEADDLFGRRGVDDAEPCVRLSTEAFATRVRSLT